MKVTSQLGCLLQLAAVCHAFAPGRPARWNARRGLNGGGSTENQPEDVDPNDPLAGGPDSSRRSGTPELDTCGDECIADEQGSGLKLDKLFRRITEMRDEEVSKDRLTAQNWKDGKMSHQACVIANSQVRQVRFASGMVAFGTFTGDLYVVDVLSGSVVEAFEGHDGEVSALTWDGEVLATGGVDCTVQVFRPDVISESTPSSPNDGLTMGSSVHILRGHTQRVTAVHLNGDVLISAGLDGNVCFWDIASGELRQTLEVEHPILSLGCSEGLLVAGLMDGRVVAHSSDPEDAIPRLLALKAHESAVRSVFLDPVRLVTGGSDGTIKVWSVEDFDGQLVIVEPSSSAVATLDTTEEGKRRQTPRRRKHHLFKGHQAAVVTLQADNSKLVSGSRDGSIRIWELTSGRNLYGIYGHTEELTSIQFEGPLLFSDGTNEAIVVHDFTQPGDDTFTI